MLIDIEEFEVKVFDEEEAYNHLCNVVTDLCKIEFKKHIGKKSGWCDTSSPHNLSDSLISSVECIVDHFKECPSEGKKDLLDIINCSIMLYNLWSE